MDPSVDVRGGLQSPHGVSWQQYRAHRAHLELKMPRFLANITCAESTFDQDIPIAVYMTKYSGYERNKPGLIFGFLKNGI